MPTKTPLNPPSLWAAVTPARHAPVTLAENVSADVVVLGGGFTGLSTALHLADKGRTVIVIEAATVGWGASGRNNGQVIPTMTSGEPDAIEKRFGAAGERFVTLVRDSASYLFDLVRRENIACEAEQTGWFQPAHSPGRVKLSAKRVDMWGKRGAPVRLLDKAETAKLLGSDAWFGGMLNTSGGHVNPLALARGLADACERKGVRIFEGSPVEAMERVGSHWIARTATGSVTANALVLATNGYTDYHEATLRPDMAATVIPVLSWQMATEPLTPAQQAVIVPGRQAVSDTHGDLRFFRYDARNRLVTGGALVVPINGAERLKRLVGERFAKLFPALGMPTFSHVWNGRIGMTTDRMPHIHQLGPDCWGWVGCNGRGVALSVSMGRELAAVIDGARPDTLGMPVTEIEPIPFHAIAQFVAPSALLLYRWRDSREANL